MAARIKFVKRGGAVAATIQESDLGAHRFGRNPPDPLVTTRAQELGLPLEINVLYLNKGTDYMQGMQRSRRMTGNRQGIKKITAPLVLTDAKAKEAADVIAFDIEASRVEYSFSAPQKWAHLEPTDVINVVYGFATFTMRLTSKNSANGVIHFTGTLEDTSIYTQPGGGAGSVIPPSQSISVPVLTHIEFLDIPLLRDADNDVGPYVAACGYRDSWNGCVLYKSIDGGNTFAELVTLVTPAKIGSALTALGDFSGGNKFDEFNSVNVQMLYGTLASISRSAVLAGGNVAVIGDEVIQYREATLISAGVYRLSGLLRGRRGTEWAMGQHTIGDRFVLAETNTWRRVSSPSSDIGVERHYKAVSFKMTLQQSQLHAFTNNADGLECLSPVHVKAGVDDQRNALISWIRRGRISGEWRDYVDVPLGETSESYEIDVMDSGFSTVKRTISSSQNSVIYTAAQQSIDFHFTVETLYLNVYQLSESVARGHVASVTIPLPEKENPSSTRWRVYSTTQQTTGGAGSTTLAFSEIQMRATVGGADQCTGGTPSADSFAVAGTEADKAFDDNTGTYWQSGTTAPHWIEYQFASAVTVAELYLRMRGTTPYGPLAWELQYYNGSSWVAVYTETAEPAWIAGEARTYTL